MAIFPLNPSAIVGVVACALERGHLDRVDMKQIRLTCTRLEGLINPMIFDRAYASMHDEDIAVLIKISGCDKLRCLVHTIVYNNVFFANDVKADLSLGTAPPSPYWYVL